MSAAEELVTAWSYPCPDPACPGHKARPYSRDRQYPSATTLIGQLDKPGLPWAAANETAKYAINHAGEWRQLNQDEAYDKLRKHHRGLWDNAALLGTTTHHAAECFASGEAFALPDDMTDPHDVAQVSLFINGLTDWWTTRQPVVLATELIVRHTSDRARYIGSLDMLALIDGVPTILDWKCTKKTDGDGYVNDWTLQTHMYALATEICHYHGTKLQSTMTWAEAGLPQPTQGMVVNIMGDGSWREFSCAIDPTVMDTIAALYAVKQFKPHMTIAAVGNQPEIVVYEDRPAMALTPSAFLD